MREREGPGSCREVPAAPGPWYGARASVAQGPVLYNHLPDLLQLILWRQVEGEPVALPFREVKEDGIECDPDRRELHPVLVIQGCLITERDLGAEVPLVFQYPGHPGPLHLPFHDLEGRRPLENPYIPLDLAR